jgi:hypothetical protein
VRVLFFPLPIFAAFLLFEITCNNRNGSALSTCTVCSRDLKVAALLFVRSALGRKKFFLKKEKKIRSPLATGCEGEAHHATIKGCCGEATCCGSGDYRFSKHEFYFGDFGSLPLIIHGCTDCVIYLLISDVCIPARAIIPVVNYVFLHAWCVCGAGYKPESNMEHASKTRTARSLLEKDVGQVRLAHLCCCKHVGVVCVCSLTLFAFPPMLALCLFNNLSLSANS